MSAAFFKNFGVPVVLFFGGAGCIVLSFNLEQHGQIAFDLNTTGWATEISPTGMVFKYMYLETFQGTWLPVDAFRNTTLDIAYASSNLECSTVLNIAGTSSNFCQSFIYATWFWPIVLVCGICFMTVGSVLGMNRVMLRCK